MIIKVKTNGIKLDELSNYCLTGNQNEDKKSYCISSDRIVYVLDYLKGKGITKVKLVMEDSDKFVQGSYNELTKKPSQLEYLEFIFIDEIKILQVTKDLDMFFKEINFFDTNNCYKTLYERICKISKVKEEIWLRDYKVNRNGIYHLACLDLCKDEDEAKRFRETLKISFKNFLEKYHPEYIEYFPNGLPYISFMRFLLKHTGRKYY